MKQLKEDISEAKEELEALRLNHGILDLYKEINQDLKKTSKRNFIIILILLVMLFATNIGWLIYESQFETVSTVEEYFQETEYTENSEIIQTIE